MGGVCSIGADRGNSLNELSFDDNGSEENDHKQFEYNPKAPSKNKTTPIVEDIEKKPCKGESTLCEKGLSSCSVSSKERKLSKNLSQKSKTNKSKPADQTKVSDVSSILGRASTAGLGKAVEVLDTLGSSMTSLNSNSGFISGVTKKGNRISILAFEVANTVVKGSNLMQSLSEQNVKHLKVVFRSEGVQNLVSKDMGELLMLAAADKRQELKVFSGEVVRFGNHCKDPRWHNLDRYFARLESEVTPPNHLKETATGEMQYLMTLVQNTAELYHELNALDRFEQDYRRRLQEEGSSVAFQKGDTIQIIKQELKNQRKHVISLKKKSLWSKILEDVMEKLVDIVHFLGLKIHDAFRITGEDQTVKRSVTSHQRLGSAGLALHYANIITQIDTLVSRSSSVPPNARDALYQALPLTVKSTLRNKLQSFQVDEEHLKSEQKWRKHCNGLYLSPITQLEHTMALDGSESGRTQGIKTLVGSLI
uniref:DUF3475 domain-containing protein n=1 Tax=Ananas comosus var. bracteatus TaxID=296719 RepID=A0A6V7QGD3_ANACO|nr:unnamed protein product [Ananas comosus var. bracteatus]